VAADATRISVLECGAESIAASKWVRAGKDWFAANRRLTASLHGMRFCRKASGERQGDDRDQGRRPPPAVKRLMVLVARLTQLCAAKRTLNIRLACPGHLPEYRVNGVTRTLQSFPAVLQPILSLQV
jgi:hypothetical protein